jgi:hypothetical protein
MMEPLFNEAVRRMVKAFESRADQLYGAKNQRSGSRSQSGGTARRGA